MLSRTRAVSSRRLRRRNPLDAKLLETRAFGERDIWIDAFSANESAVAPRIRRAYSNPQPPKLFRNASPNATFAPTGHSRDEWSASLTDLANPTVAAT